MSWSIKASVTSIPIHGGMSISIKDVPEGRKSSVKKLRQVLDGLSFEKIQELLSKTQFSDRVSVHKMEQSA